MLLFWTLMIVASTTADIRVDASDASAAVTQVIADFEPFVLPVDQDLRGVTAGLDWEPGATCGPACAHRLALTAGYLFHAVQRRSGTLVLSHAPGDDTLNSPAGRTLRGQTLQAGHCSFALILRCEHVGGEGSAAAAASAAPPNEFATALQAALGKTWSLTAPPAPQESPLNEMATMLSDPLAEVRAPVRSAPAGAEWRDARADALALASALALYAQAHERKQPPAANEPVLDGGRTARVARELWPEGDLPPERVGWFCTLVQRLALTNPALIYARVEASSTDEGVVLEGAASSPCVPEVLTRALRAVGIEKVVNKIRPLPDRSRIGGQAYGACCVASVLTRSAPRELAGLQTELLYGEPVYLLDREGDYLLLLGGDGYWGWTRSAAIALMDEAHFAVYVQAAEGVVRHDFDSNGVRIPRGARIRLASVSAHDVAVMLPDGGRLRLAAEAVEPMTDAAAAERRVHAALELLHTPYVFGGRSPSGLDCSGLVNNVAAQCGASAARDANQQAHAGQLSATAWFRMGLRAGDQVFFIDPSGKVYHTGIAVNATHIVHSAPPGVQIGTFVRGDRLYDPRIDRDFFIAKRP